MTGRVNGLSLAMVAGAVLAGALALGGCTAAGSQGAPTPSQSATHAEPTFRVPDAALPTPLVMVAYGDMRFTDPSELAATSPAARQALVAKVAVARQERGL